MNRLEQLRTLMKQHSIDTYFITKFDPHQGEYTHDMYNGVKFISGFSGSSATAVVTQDKAYMWTDGRYYLQAENELAQGFTMQKLETDLGAIPFAIQNTPKGTIGFDGSTLNVQMVQALLKSKHPETTIKTDVNLINQLWDDRPTFERANLWNYSEQYNGENTASKLAKVRETMKQKGADIYLISAIDDIAWLLNIRSVSSESAFNFYAYLAIEPHSITLFVDQQADDETLPVPTRPYNGIWAYATENSEKTLLFTPNKTNYTLFNHFTKKKLALPHDITTLLKARKNKVEIESLKEANKKEALVFTKLNRWLAHYSENDDITEYDVFEKLDKIRHSLDGYLGRSFYPICGYGSNGAIIHYHLDQATAKPIKREGFLLVDTGSNFIEGTTDITRTYVMGPITDEMKKHYTAVLQGHIALATARFPKGTKGFHLDAFARRPLWEMGLNYRHGTGHGIGHLLNVHEGPQNISPTMVDVVLEEGMLLSNEPGVYFDGSYGIRLENTILVKKSETTDFLEFETVSYIPFDLRAIDVTMLSDFEKKWLNDYHKVCFDNLKVFLCEVGTAWLAELTRAI